MEIKIREKTSVTQPEIAARIFLEVLQRENTIDQNKEHFWAAGLNTKNRIIYVELVSLGILDSSLVHPREVFRMAIQKGVSGLIMVHNHPSGDPHPSGQDIDITKKISESGRIIGIDIIDHIIIGRNSKDGFTSFKAKSMI